MHTYDEKKKNLVQAMSDNKAFTNCWLHNLRLGNKVQFNERLGHYLHAGYSTESNMGSFIGANRFACLAL